MGQRHQIYLRLPKHFYNKGNSNNRPEETIGIHHQWIWGGTALHFLCRALDFQKNSVEDGYQFGPSRLSIEKSQGCLEAIYSCDPAIGYYHDVHKLDAAECKNPFLGDNNNGITVIDFADPKNPAYCFLSLTHLECLRDDIKDDEVKNGVPMSAEEWIALHYKHSKINSMDDEDGFFQRIRSNLYRIRNVSVITKERLNKIFKDFDSLDAKATIAREKMYAKFAKKRGTL